MLQSGNFGRLLEPGLRKIFFDSYRELPEQYSKVFRTETSNKAIETDYRMGGFGEWEKKDSMGQVKYQEPTSGQSLQYIHEEFASGFVVERKLIDDEEYREIKKMPAELAKSARRTVEAKSITVLANAFTANGYDGVPLINDAHPRLDKGMAVANQVSGALTDQNLKDALVLAREQVDETGMLIQMLPKLLVVHHQLEYTAKTIIGSANLSPNGDGTLAAGVSNAATDKNVIQNGLQVVVLDYLPALDKTTNAPATSSTTAGNTVYPWFVLDPTVAQLNFFWRKRLEFKNTEDFDSMQAKYRGYMRFSYGYSDFRGVIGSPGY